MSKRVFISFSYRELDWQNDLLQHFQRWGGPAQATPVFIERSAAELPDSQVRGLINERLSGCVGLLLVVGNNAQSSKWIGHEVQVASSAGLPVAGTRHPQASGPLPSAFPKVQMLPWEGTEIASWIFRLPRSA